MRKLALAAWISIALAATAVAQEKPAELGPDAAKIHKVVLYKHGVGYFERQGHVDGNARIALYFKEPQMRDLLKSFYALDLGGGTISTIAYEGQQPVGKRLQEIRIHVPAGQAFSGLLASLQGVKIELVVGDKRTTCRVLGLEPVTTKVDDHHVVTSHKVVIQLDNGAITAVPLNDVTGYTVADETLAKELARYLELNQDARRTGQKKVTVMAEGKGKREIRLGYIVESPIWKTSYRLIFDKDKKPLLQGWAIVDNATEEDWDAVDLSLVGGSPISFSLDLYTPYYPARPQVGIQRFASTSAAPAASAKAAERRRRAMTFEEAPAGGAPAPEPAPADDEAKKDSGPMAGEARDMAEQLQESVKSAASGAQVGELFQYKVKLPVSIKKGSSGLVPILMERVDGAKALYFAAHVQPQHPMNAVLLKNTSALVLESGPLTFFEEATCAGEGMTSRLLRPGDEELIPYSVEATVTVETASQSRQSDVTRAILTGGVLNIYSFHERDTVYKVFNKGGKAATLYLDHPKAAGFELSMKEKPDVDLPGVTRWKVELKADETREFPIRERMEIVNQVTFWDGNPDSIAFQLQQTYLKEGARKLLKEIQTLGTELQQASRALQQMQQEEQQITHDQERIRANMGSLRNTPEENRIRSKYLSQMEKGDTRLEAIRETAVKLREKVAEIQGQIREKLLGFKDD